MLFISACVLAPGFGSYSYTNAMNKCVKEILFVISESCRNEAELDQILEQLNEFIEFHSRVKQLSNFDKSIQSIVSAILINKNQIDSGFVTHFATIHCVRVCV